MSSVMKKGLTFEAVTNVFESVKRVHLLAKEPEMSDSPVMLAEAERLNLRMFVNMVHPAVKLIIRERGESATKGDFLSLPDAIERCFEYYYVNQADLNYVRTWEEFKLHARHSRWAEKGRNIAKHMYPKQAGTKGELFDLIFYHAVLPVLCHRCSLLKEPAGPLNLLVVEEAMETEAGMLRMRFAA